MKLKIEIELKLDFLLADLNKLKNFKAFSFCMDQ